MNQQNISAKTIAKTFLIIGISVVLGVLADYFFYGKAVGLAFPVYVGLVTVGLFAISLNLHKKLSRQVMWLLVPLSFFSVMVFVRSSELLSFLNIVASLLLLFMIAEVSFSTKIKNFVVGDYVKVAFLPFSFITPLSQTLSALSTVYGTSKNSKKFSQVVRGVMMVIPVLVIFAILLSSADSIFKKYISNVIDISIQPETIFRLLIVAGVALLFTGAYSYIFSETEKEVDKTSHKEILPTLGHIETSILFGSINLLFFAFILVQFAYLFGGESTVSVQGFSYAEYARKGFFELIMVAVISFLLIRIAEKSVTRNETGHTLLFKVVSSVLIVQVIIIMVSAFKRLALYEEAFGFTTLRLYSHAFTVFLAVIFLLLLYKIFKDAREQAFAFRVFVSIILFLVAMNVLNPDLFIAKRNLERLVATENVDVYYLKELSDDAMPVLISVLDKAEGDTKKIFGQLLYFRAINNVSSEAPWQSMNRAHTRAKEMLEARKSELEVYKDFRPESAIFLPPISLMPVEVPFPVLIPTPAGR